MRPFIDIKVAGDEYEAMALLQYLIFLEIRKKEIFSNIFPLVAQSPHMFRFIHW